MKVLVCGSRDWTSWPLIWETLNGLGPNTIIVHGDARGADKMAGHVANKLGYEVRPYPANWSLYGVAAGPRRNRAMFDTEQPDLVICFHNDLNASKGSRHMVQYARSRGCPVNVVYEEA